MRKPRKPILNAIQILRRVMIKEPTYQRKKKKEYALMSTTFYFTFTLAIVLNDACYKDRDLGVLVFYIFKCSLNII